tara:strand:+ start:458 stop:604 length:147 start_codon:yes stop_codon:yes gene_type:complete
VLLILEVKEDDDTPDDIVFVASKTISPDVNPVVVTEDIELLLYLTNAI